MLTDCGIKHDHASIIWCNNRSTIVIAKNLALYRRTKLIDLRYHFIRNLVADGIITLEHCRTEEQTVDILTKALTIEKHIQLRAQLGVCSLQSQEGVEVIEENYGGTCNSLVHGG